MNKIYSCVLRLYRPVDEMKKKEKKKEEQKKKKRK